MASLPKSAPAERPRLLVVAGPNGSGSISVTEQGLRHEWFSDCLCINSDNLARDKSLQAAQLADALRERALTNLKRFR